ncbi:MAG: AAA family ATPase [Candidatus Caldarchaeum sp.]
MINLSLPVLPGREEETRVLALSLITRQHYCLIGPPGTGKSLLIQLVSSQFNVPYFSYVLTKFTTLEELFGPLDVKALREEGRLRHITLGRLPEACLAFLDEIFNSSSSILNSLLAILNERRFFNDGQWVTCPLWTAAAASNRVPDEPELQALWDRFEFRLFNDYIPPDRWEEYLSFYWTHHMASHSANPTLDFSVVESLHSQLRSVDVFSVKHQLLNVFARLRDKSITVSDRRKGRALFALAAESLMNGRKTVTPEDLLVLKYVIPSNADEVQVVQQVVIDTVGSALKFRQVLTELKPQLESLITKLENATSFEEALRIAESLKPLSLKVSGLPDEVKSLDVYQQVRFLIDEFSIKLAEKVRL